MSENEWNRNVAEAIASGELRDAIERAEAAEERADALEAEVRRLREWQRTISDACGLTEIHMGYSPHVPDATPGVVAHIQEAFTRSLYHAECERVEWEQAVARGEV